jgi:AcrR family transcriptional regulator
MPAASPASEPAGGRDRLLEAAIEYFREHGIGDASLRQIASGVGSSHRMLIYHFGSREGLLEAVVAALERAERDVLQQVLAADGRPGRVRAWEFWTHVADVVDFYGPLFFELAARAMREDGEDAPLRGPNVEMWVRALADMWQQTGMPRSQARVHARLNLAVARGLLHDFLLTRDRKAVDQAMAMYDWLCFREPHPSPRLARLSRTWTPPRDLP